MYKKIILIVLMLLVIVRSEKTSAKNVTQANFLNLRSTILPYLSLHKNQNFTKDNEKKSLDLLISSQTRDEYKKPKEISQKTKRCGTSLRKNRVSSLSRKEDSNRTEMNTRSLNRNIKIPKTLIKSVKYSQENPATSNRIKTEIHKDTFLRSLRNNLNVENVMLNSESRAKTKKSDKENCICYCKEENCASKSSIKNSSEILNSSRKDKSEKINQQILPKLCHKNLHELRLPSSINSFRTRLYQERVRDIPRVAILYGKPNILPHIIGSEKKFIGIPFTTFEDRPNFLTGSNAYNQYQQIIRQNLNPSPRKVEENQVGSPIITTTSSSTSYTDDVMTITQTESDLESTEKDQDFFKPTTETSTDHVLDMSIDSEMETNFYPNYSNNVDEESSTINFSNEAMNKLDDSIESIVGNKDDNFSKLMSSSINNIDRSETSPITYPSFMRDEKLINMEECIKLFGRDVCVLSAYSVTSPEILTKQAPKNNMNEYSTIRIPEYIVQMSAKEGTTSINVDYSDKFKTPEMSNVDSNEYLESTSTELTVDDDDDETFLQEFYAESKEHTDEPNDDYDENKLFNSEEDTLIPMKKYMGRTIDKPTKTAKNTQLGKSNSHKVESLLNPNNKETTSSILRKEETTTISYDFKTGYNFEEEITNRLIESEIDTSPERKILQGQSEEITTIVHDSKAMHNFEEKSMHDLKKLNTDFDPEDEILQFKEKIIPISSDSNIKYNVEEVTENDFSEIKTDNPEDEIFQEQSEMQYLEGTDYLNNKEDVTNNLETIIDSSSEKLPFYDNTLLLNSIRKVINDFASNASSAKTKDLDENILQVQGSDLLPEILQIPNLESILLIPQIENTIVEKVKDILSDITASPKGHFTDNWSHDVIRNTFRNILQALSSGFHRKLPPITIDEHQFKNGQWTIDSITLAPVPDKKISLANPENLRDIIKNLLNSSAIASQIDHYIVRNMIVQSVKNSLTKNGHEEIENSIIHELNDILRTLKDSEDTDVLGNNNNKFIDNEKNVDLTFPQIISTNDYEKAINIDNSISINKQNPGIENNAKIDNENMPIYKINENITDQISNGIQKIDMQDDEVKEKLAEPSKIAVTYHKAILQNNLGIISAISVEPNLEIDKINEKKENILTPAISSTTNYDTNNKNIQVTTIPSNFIQEISPQISDGIISENMIGVKDIGNKYVFNEEILTKSINNLESPTNVKYQNEKLKIDSSTDEIDPAIILERIEHGLSPIKYYSPEILKYIKNHRDNNDDVNVKPTTTNSLQETFSDYTQISDDVTKLNYDKTLSKTTSAKNVISSLNIDHENYESEITPSIDKDILDLQQHNFVTKGVIDKIHEVTTEVQRTYAKTTYFKVNPSADDNPKINSPAFANSNNKDKNSNNYNDNLIGNKIYNIDYMEQNKQRAISCPKSCFLGNIYPLQLFPSDNIKLPVEVEKLEDGSYALSISKNICEQILERKCSCCVPLQGHLILSWDKNQDQKNIHVTSDREDMKNIERYYHSTESPNVMKTLMKTRRNTLKVQKSEEEQKERMRAHDLWKRNLNDNNLITILMPVIDFAKKYLLLDSNKTESHDIKQKSLMKSVGKFDNDQLKKKNLNDIFEARKKYKLNEIKDPTDKLQNSVNFREGKDTLSINFPRSSISRDFHNSESSIKIESQKKNSTANQFKITKNLRKLETEKDIQNINTEEKNNSENQKRHPILKRINISKEDTEMKNEEMKSNKYRVADVGRGNVKDFRKKKDKKSRQTIGSENHERIPISRIIISGNKDNIESEETNWDELTDIEEGNVYYKKEKEDFKVHMMDNNKQNVPRIKISEENNKKPYRSQRNANNVANKRVELVKSVLYWLKGLFLDE